MNHIETELSIGIFEIGQKVKRYIDVYDKTKGFKEGVITRRFSRSQYRISDIVLGPYEELYEVLWDDGTIGKSYLPHGLIKIN